MKLSVISNNKIIKVQQNWSTEPKWTNWNNLLLTHLDQECFISWIKSSDTRHNKIINYWIISIDSQGWNGLNQWHMTMFTHRKTSAELETTAITYHRELRWRRESVVLNPTRLWVWAELLHSANELAQLLLLQDKLPLITIHTAKQIKFTDLA